MALKRNSRAIFMERKIARSCVHAKVTAKSEGYESFSPNECYSDNFGAANERFSVPGSSALFPCPSRSVAFPPRVATRRDRFGKSSPARQLQASFRHNRHPERSAAKSKDPVANREIMSRQVAASLKQEAGDLNLSFGGNAAGFKSPASSATSAALRLDFAFDSARNDRR